jgi:NAD(P)-dependent dehydrogenase (short-subunit alcohol dehydrogenase family)
MQDKIVFVTGAGQGLGRAVALACAAQGATVILHGRKPEKLDAVYDAIIASGGAEPFLMPLDYTQAAPDAFSTVANALTKECGRIDALIHCAVELGSVSPIEHQSLDNLRATWLVNVLGPVMLTRACMRALRASTTPSVTFCTDSHVGAPAPYWGGYGVSKAAIDHFARMLALEWDWANVHCFVPGAIDSPLRNKTHPGETKSAREPISYAATQLLDTITAL